MKWLAAIALIISTASSACGNTTDNTPKEATKPTTERVCIMVYDAKLKKETEKCRTIKIHEKHDGTAVPK